MDADGLPLVGPGVDYTKVEAIHQKRTLAFLNHFVSHTASFLNRFSCVCEEKLDHMSSRLQQLEITMNILEAKLTSIPGLENITAPSAGQASTSASQADTAVTPQAATQQTVTDQPGAPPPAEIQEPPPPAEEQNPVSKDSRYAKYFKMIQVGVPAAAISNKMIAEGLDPDLLNTPDAPAPSATTASKKKDDSDDYFSDESDSSDSFCD